MPHARRTKPYAATVIGAKWFSSIQPVVNGMSESQKSRCMFAHNTSPLTLRVAINMWWWLFQ